MQNRETTLATLRAFNEPNQQAYFRNTYSLLALTLAFQRPRRFCISIEP